jgi:hypothetical protein
VKRVSKKDVRILNLLNDFGWLDEDFFITLFHSRSKKNRSAVAYKVNSYVGRLANIGFVTITKVEIGSIYYSLSPNGCAFLSDKGIRPYINNVAVNNGKFFHSMLCAKVFAKVASIYNVKFQSENFLIRNTQSPIVPDLALKIGDNIIYFEIERSLKSEVLIKEKLSSYDSNFKNGYLIYLTGNDSIIKKISKIKYAYQCHKKIFAFDLNKFINDPIPYLNHVGPFLTGLQIYGN